MFIVIVDGLVTKVVQSNQYDHSNGKVTRGHLKSCLFLYQVYNVVGSLEIFLTVVNTHNYFSKWGWDNISFRFKEWVLNLIFYWLGHECSPIMKLCCKIWDVLIPYWPCLREEVHHRYSEGGWLENFQYPSGN